MSDGLREALRGLSPRRSFRARLLVAFLATVGVLLLATLLAIRTETARQVEAVTRQAVSRAEEVFEEAEEFRRGELDSRARPFTRGIRAAAVAEEALQSGDVEALAENVEYQFAVTQMDLRSLLVVFADPEGRPVLTLLDGERHLEGDRADVGPLVSRAAGGGDVVRGYRLVGEELFSLQVYPLTLGPRPVGSVVLGYPLTDAEAREVGDLVGAEVCFVARGRCVAGTALARTELAGVLGVAGDDPGDPVPEDPDMVSAGGERWQVSANPLVPGRPEEGAAVIAVPMDEVLAPFERISRTLLWAGLGALAMAILASAILARGLARPIRALVGATERVARGEYDAEVTVDREDDLGTLAAAFNEMTRGLRLKERYRGVLDKVVSREVAEELTRGEIALGGETRRATVVFADLRGFTALTEGMDPRDVIDLLNECMEILSAAVDAEGGVVDKYVGDEIMAIWGAPVSGPDDEVRAVRAALRMREGMEGLNRRRVARGEPAIGLGIGVSSGEVVAGNMGSAERLNYTVLGADVNLASRLCSTAAPGEILLSRRAAEAVADTIAVVPLEERTLKGFSEPVPLFVPEEVAGAAGPERPRGTGRALAFVLAALAASAAAGTAAPAAGQERALPTLREAGASWMSPSGTWQLDLSGRLELEGYLPDEDPPGLIPTSDPFLAPRLRVFADLFAGDDVYGLLELRADRGDAPGDGDMEAGFEQLFVRWSPGGGPVALQVGRFATPLGSYPARHHSMADFFVRPPLPYDFPTVICACVAPETAEGFLTWRDDPGRFRPRGAPPVWGIPYVWGAQLSGAWGPVSLRGAWTNAAPSSAPEEWAWDADQLGRGAVVAGAGIQLSPSLRVGGSWSVGPWMEPDAAGPFPPGRGADEWDQEIFGAEMAWSRGPWVVRAESFLDRWEVPNAGDDFRELSWYVEAQRDVLPGAWVAGRVGGIDFLAWDWGTYRPDRAGQADEWDYDALRLEAAAGLRLARNLGVTAQVGTTRSEGPLDPADDLVAVQLWWEF